jgi:hypothetical protein
MTAPLVAVNDVSTLVGLGINEHDHSVSDLQTVQTLNRQLSDSRQIRRNCGTRVKQLKNLKSALAKLRRARLLLLNGRHLRAQLCNLGDKSNTASGLIRRPGSPKSERN